MKHIALLGSTGSIGESTLKVVRHLGPDAVRITALAAKTNVEKLERQAKEFRPAIVAIYDEKLAPELQRRLPGIEVVAGMDGVVAAASHAASDMVVSAMSGTLGLIPTVAAIKARKHVGLANKEALVSGGALVMSLAKEYGVSIIPIDSEHSAIFQCLNGENPAEVRRIILTASGGPFRTYSTEQLKGVTLEDALRHPTWTMGHKVTIDSSTLMNKGLEVIEASWLYHVPVDKIDVVVHPQSIIHSMVEFVDGSIMAQMNLPSMINPIQYAITYPERKPGIFSPFDFVKHGVLEFFAPDTDKFRCLALAYEAIRKGGTLPCYMNAANEVLVERFISRQISWEGIANKLETLMERHRVEPAESLDAVMAADMRAREEAKTI